MTSKIDVLINAPDEALTEFEKILRDEVIKLRARITDTDTPSQPVIPDGWQVVPKEPTEDMVISGFESEPDESFSDPEVWEAYESMSGCQQAAHRAKLCWAAMLAAAPMPEESHD